MTTPQVVVKCPGCTKNVYPSEKPLSVCGGKWHPLVRFSLILRETGCNL
jgi:hypothetical protein